MTTPNQEMWADSAPEYKKDGELHANVEYDHEGNPRLVQLSQNLMRRGEFQMENGTAVYIPHNLALAREAGRKEREYVESLPFVDEIEMGNNGCPECGEKQISPPPQTLSSPPVYECPECGWRGEL